MLKINIAKIVPSYTKVKNAPNKTLARTHYINFLKAEDEFFKSAERFESNMNNWSLKAIPEFFVSVKHVGKMFSEKVKSAYYFQK